MGDRLTRRSGPVGLTREEILGAAKAITMEDGLDALTMRRLADRLGVSPMATYRHFESRQSLIDSLVDEVSREILDYPDFPSDAWQDRLRTLIHQVLRVFDRYPGLARFLYRGSHLNQGMRLIDRMTEILLAAGYGQNEAAVRWLLLWELLRAMSLRFEFGIEKSGEEVRDLHGFAISSEYFREMSGHDACNHGIETMIGLFEMELDRLKRTPLPVHRTGISSDVTEGGS